MKKQSLLIISVLLFFIMLAAIFTMIRFLDHDGIRKGMPFTDYYALISEEDRFDYLGYSFYEKENGDSVVVQFSPDGKTVEKVRVYPRFLTSNTQKRFHKIESGMTIYKVVSLVGVPHYSATSGMISMVFDAADGTEYSIYFTREDFSSNSDLIVSRVTILD